VRSHGLIPEHAPLHPENTAPGAGAGSNRIKVPPNTATSQWLEQSATSCEEWIDPLPAQGHHLERISFRERAQDV